MKKYKVKKEINGKEIDLEIRETNSGFSFYSYGICFTKKLSKDKIEKIEKNKGVVNFLDGILKELEKEKNRIYINKISELFLNKMRDEINDEKEENDYFEEYEDLDYNLFEIDESKYKYSFMMPNLVDFIELNSLNSLYVENNQLYIKEEDSINLKVFYNDYSIAYLGLNKLLGGEHKRDRKNLNYMFGNEVTEDFKEIVGGIEFKIFYLEYDYREMSEEERYSVIEKYFVGISKDQFRYIDEYGNIVFIEDTGSKKNKNKLY